MVYSVYSLELPQRGDSNEETQYTFMLKKIKNMSVLCLLTWGYVNTHLFQLPLSRTYFHGSKRVRAIEVLLYYLGGPLRNLPLTVET